MWKFKYVNDISNITEYGLRRIVNREDNMVNEHGV